MSYFWIWIAILVVVALVALFKVSPFDAGEPATQGGDDDKPDDPPEDA